MQINKLKLQNFRCFEEYELALSERFTLLIGDNGSGKTAVLDALATAVSEFLEGFKDYSYTPVLRNEDMHPTTIHDARYELLEMGQNPIKETALPASINAEGIIDNRPISWIIDQRKGGMLNPTNRVAQIRDIAVEYANKITDTRTILPLLGFYGTQRLWKHISKNINTSSPKSRLLGYHNCLNPASDLQELFSWFKTQEFASLQKKERRHVLEAVREAIVCMIPDAQKVWWDVDWDEILIETIIQGKPQTIPFHLLSDGYRNMIGMVADIAYRMATLNPQLEADVIKQTEGIVLIDEIDLHLHPKWQKQVVERLLDTFPKVQFVASSHSPFIIQSLYRRDDCLLWDLEKNAPVEVDSKSIEDIAENQQGVEIPQQSQRFLDMEEAAEDYYTVLKQIPPASEDEKQRLRQRLDELLLPYSDDPAFQAFLKMERQAVEGNAEE